MCDIERKQGYTDRQKDRLMGRQHRAGDKERIKLNIYSKIQKFLQKERGTLIIRERENAI